MSNIALTSLELKEVTGYALPKKQVEALMMMGIPFKIRPNGKPFVARSCVDNSLTHNKLPVVVKDL